MILIIDDDMGVRTSLKFLLSQEGYSVEVCEHPEKAEQILQEVQPSLILLDMNYSVDTTGKEGLDFLGQLEKRFPQVPVILITGWGSVSLAVEGMKRGASDFIQKPWNNEHLLQSVQTNLTLSQQERPTEDFSTRKELDKAYNFSKIVGKSPALMEILNTIGRIAPTDASVLIQGESGTGKELIAEAIHENSRRRDRPFIKVNLGGMPANLFESEMFGHKKGAFTDAHHDRKGRFELADGGTIFLDEIGDLDLNSQVKLLRVLQDRTYEVLGDSKSRQVDVRVVCATNRDLVEMVKKGSFREDLFYRINLIQVKLPALRERSEDIPLIVQHFLNNMKGLYQRDKLSVTRKALNWLKELPYPGNIREIKNLVERTVLVSPNDSLDVGDFQSQFQGTGIKRSSDSLPAVGTMTLDEMEKAMISKALEFHKSNISKAARSLGLSRAALYRRLEKHEIPYEN
ncbi:MAG: sigma-54 dependent transcriptional regulator [Bacteroidota bacterium]